LLSELNWNVHTEARQMKTLRSFHVIFALATQIATIVLLLFGNFSEIAVAQVQGNRYGAFVYTGNTPWGSPTNAVVKGYVINGSSGTLTSAAGMPYAAGGQVLAIAAHPTGKFVYVATANGTVAAFTVDSYSGTLTPVPGSPYATLAGNPAALAIDPSGKYLYEAANSQLYGFAINSGSGALTALPGSPYAAVGAIALVADPSDQYLVVSNGSGAWTYAITSSTGALTAVNSMVSGCGGASMTFEPSGHFLYGSYGGITACSFDSGSGALSAVTGSPFATGSGASFSGIATHPSGSFLYATDVTCVDGGSPNRLYGFVVDPSTGALTAIGGSPFTVPGSSGCDYDEDVAAEASGNFVYTVDANYGVASYKVNAATGALMLASNSYSGPGAFTLTTVPNAMSSTATVTGLEITPATAQITTSSLGKQYQFTLKATYSDGSTGFLTESAQWSSSDQTVATVAAGLATSTGYGPTTITASIGGQSATASLTVIMPTLSSISITPQAVTVYSGTALQLAATAQYADGSSVDLTNSVTWSSSDNTIVTVTAQGLMQTVAIGAATITATDGSVSGTASVTALTPFVWKTPDPISYGTALGATQLNATSGATGTYVYNPPSGTVLSVGNQALNVAFTPDSTSSSNASTKRTLSKVDRVSPRASATAPNGSSYLAVNAKVYLKVNSVPLTVTANNTSMPYGSALPTLSGTLTGVISGDNITASYSTTATSTSPVGSYPVTAALNDPNGKLGNYTVTNTSGTLTIGSAKPVITWAPPATILTGASLASVLNATAVLNTQSIAGSFSYTATSVGGSASTITSATVLAAGSYTLTATFAPTDKTDLNTVTATALLAVNNPQPVLTSMSPALTSAGNAGFTLTVNGTGFVSNSAVYWGTTALTTTLVSATQLQAQVPATAITSAGTSAVSVQTPTPGGGASNSMQFEIDSASASYEPSFTTVTATVSAGQSASYSVTPPASASNLSVTCLNLPASASCSYDSTAKAVTISTTSSTPAGTYQITVIFTETVTTSAGWIMAPFLLLPLLFVRRRMLARGFWLTICLCLATLIGAVAAVGCGGGSSTSTSSTPQQSQVTASGSVSLIVK
jgi:hypothetical protein